MADRGSSKPEEEVSKDESSSSIKVYGMQFSYDGQPTLFADFNLNISTGSRCLLVGANGSGKQITLLLFPNNLKLLSILGIQFSRTWEF